MFKSHELIVNMRKKPKSDEEGLSPRPPFDRIDIEMLSHEITEDIVSAYLVIKGVKTLCSILEHIVVTRVK